MVFKNRQLKLHCGIGVIVVVLGLGFVLWYHYAKDEIYKRKRNPIRPKDFPEVLTAPDNAELLDYLTPEGGESGKTAYDTYNLSYAVNDPYPSGQTFKYIEDRLRDYGWQRIRYSVRYPTAELPAGWRSVPEYIERSQMELLSKNLRKWREIGFPWVRLGWIQEEKDEYIQVVLGYIVDIKSRKVIMPSCFFVGFIS